MAIGPFDRGAPPPHRVPRTRRAGRIVKAMDPASVPSLGDRPGIQPVATSAGPRLERMIGTL